MKPLWTAVASSAVALAGLSGPLSIGATAFGALGPAALFLAISCLIAALVNRFVSAALLLPLGLAGVYLSVTGLMAVGGAGEWGYWATFLGFLVSSIAGVSRLGLVEIPPDTPKWERHFRQLLPAAAIPFVLLLIWQGLVVGNQVPRGIFPSVVDVWVQLGASAPVLMSDAYVTFVKEVLLGLAIGLTTGFAFGLAVSYSSFLQRGFLPLAAAFGAVPIVGLAPVLGRAFGVNWESKAAVVVIVTFFPIVLNTVQGITRVEANKLELLKAYAAKPFEVFWKLRLPNALPFLFNALKLALVISVISVVVAEFLIPGPPEGLGQRISLSARRGAYDVVFAAIVVTSAISILLYSLLSVVERMVTGWHASFREEGS